MNPITIRKELLETHIAFLQNLGNFLHEEEAEWEKQLSSEIEGENTKVLAATKVETFQEMRKQLGEHLEELVNLFTP